ncbi:MAG TPA: MOSC N-terminal beta barrel domain-containing protein, partial [Solirubrobacteraceae bacterium]|nr:MOSC N-terminal beta barrel domain-containing protein [Solirubrobacteraceae bacterium]
MPATVSALALAPVKGMRLMAAEFLDIGAAGAEGDRAFVVVDADGRLVATERTPALLQVAPRWDPFVTGVLSLGFPDGSQAAGVPELAAEATTELHDGRRLRGRLVGAGPLGDALSIHLGRPV